MSYINSIEPPSNELSDIVKMPKRFAKFILKPPVKKEPEVVESFVKENIEEEKDKNEDNKKTKKSSTKKEKKRKKSDKKIAKKSPAKLKKSKRRVVAKKVREKLNKTALLGVFTSKEVVEEEEEIFSSIDDDIDSLTADIGKGEYHTNAGQKEVTSYDKLSDEFSDADGIVGEGEDFGEYQGEVISDEDDKLTKLAKLAPREDTTLDYEKRASEIEKEKRRKLRRKAEIDKVVRVYSGGLKFLYNSELRKDPTLRGKIVVKFTISPKGKVIGAEIVESTLNNKKLDKGIIRRIKKWKFPPKKVENTTVVYPFVFMPVG